MVNITGFCNNYLTKTKGSKIYQLTDSKIKSYLVTNVDTEFIRTNLFQIDYDYWSEHRSIPIKYIYIHFLDTLYQQDKKIVVSYFEAYKDYYDGRFYIKLCKIEDGLISSTITLASENPYLANNTTTSSVILPCGLLIDRQVTEEYCSSDNFDYDVLPYECNDITQFTFFDFKTFSFKPLFKTQHKYYNREVAKYCAEHPPGVEI